MHILLSDKHYKYITWFLFIIFFLCGFLLGAFKNENTKTNNSFNEIRLKDSKYQFINPLLECGLNENLISEAELKNNILSIIQKYTLENNITDYSIYFRNLNNGPWLGINENENFSLASLAKVPLLMAVYKIAESDPTIMKTKISVDNIDDYEQQVIKPQKKLEKGKSYTLEELVNQMIIHSDNVAQRIIYNNIDKNYLVKIYSDLGISFPATQKTENYMSIKTYVSFFRILYNASYLNKYYSDQALELLSKSEYKDGLVSGVPADVLVAHKFGEKPNYASNEKQLHDCGIIYNDKEPYLLCIMSRGNNYKQMSNFIKEISNFFYLQVAKNN